MPIVSQCRAISSSFSHNLRLTRTDEERHRLAAQALEYLADKVFSALDALRLEKGDKDDQYRLAQEAVIEVASFICIPYVRSCKAHSSAISHLEDQAAKCNDPLVKKKLVIYSNQLKNTWNKLEPGGIHHTPRASRRGVTTVSGSTYTTVARALIGVAIVCGLLYFLIKSDLTTAVISGWKRTTVEQPTPIAEKLVERQEGEPSAEPAVKSEVIGAAPGGLGPGDFCRYTDDNGVLHIVNDPAKVPARYRMRMEVTPSGGNGSSTKVVCRGNQVLVPVTLRYRGREVQTTLLLDTGASTTTINERVASRLEVDEAGARLTPSTVADGRTVASYTFGADSISVGGRGLSGVNISILPGSGGNGYDGLLGMNFLKEFRYHVDFRRSIIEWGS